MNCPKHPSQKLTQLFTSAVCDICDPPAESKVAAGPGDAFFRMLGKIFCHASRFPTLNEIVKVEPMPTAAAGSIFYLDFSDIDKYAEDD